MREKVIDIGSWSRMDLPVHLIKVSSRGLIGNDRADFLKLASHVFAEAIDNIKLASGDIPIHLNAIGSTEYYGYNRNGDGFTEPTNRACHQRFVKDARYYRNHQNKDPAKSYGAVKLSAYNDPMHRVELLVLGNGNAEAAQRNGGLLMKHATIERLERGEDVGFSMACKVAHDVCCNCFNKAANRSQYCTEDTCINPETGFRGFGCTSGLTKVADNGFVQGVDNPDPYFFDISEVARNADRIALGSRADYLTKAASNAYVPGGFELAEKWAHAGADFTLRGPEETIFNRRIMNLIKLARDLAECERTFESTTTKSAEDLAYARVLGNPAGLWRQLKAPNNTELTEKLAALAQVGVAISIYDFVQLLDHGTVEKAAEASRYVPGIFGRLVADPDFSYNLQESPFALHDVRPSAAIRQWAIKQAAVCSYDPEVMREQVFASVVSQRQSTTYRLLDTMVKTASTAEPYEQIARQYAMYKLAAMSLMLAGAKEPAALKAMCIRQNYVS